MLGARTPVDMVRIQFQYVASQITIYSSDDSLSWDSLETIMDNEALRALLAMRKCAKEITEAYGAAEQAIMLLAASGRCATPRLPF